MTDTLLILGFTILSAITLGGCAVDQRQVDRTASTTSEPAATTQTMPEDIAGSTLLQTPTEDGCFVIEREPVTEGGLRIPAQIICPEVPLRATQ